VRPNEASIQTISAGSNCQPVPLPEGGGSTLTPTPYVFVDNFFERKVQNGLLLGILRGLNSAHFEGATTTGSDPMPELSFDHPRHLDQFDTHVAVYDQLFIYSPVNIFIICM